MKNKKIWLGMLILVFIFVISSCDLLSPTVPAWAIGKWKMSVLGSSVKVDAAEITSSEFIPAEALQLLLFKRAEVTLVSGNTVSFGTTQVKKVSATEISVSIAGVAPTTLTK